MKNLRPPLPETSTPWDVLLGIIFTEIRPVKAVSHQRSIYLQILISIVLLTLTYIFRDRQKYPRQEKKPETELSPKLQLLFQRPAVQGFLQAASSLPRAECRLPQLASSLPLAEARFPRAECRLPQMTSSLPRAESRPPQAGTGSLAGILRVPGILHRGSAPDLPFWRRTILSRVKRPGKVFLKKAGNN